MAKLVIQNGRMFDSINGQFKHNQTIVCENSLIIWVGDSDSYEPNPEDNTIDATNKTILPGLMDCHVHIELNNDAMRNLEAYQFSTKESYAVLLGLKNAQEYLKYGVTTIRDCAGFIDRGGSSIRRVIEDGVHIGPRLLVAQKSMRQFGDQEVFGPENWIELSKEDVVVGGRDNIIEEVRARKRNGSDFIKTQTTGGVLHGKESKLGRSLWRDEELELMVDEAERLGMYIAAHAHTEPGINAAVRAGVRTIEHGSLLDENTIDLMLEKNTYLVPTHSPGHYFTHANPEALKVFPPEVQRKAAEVSVKKDAQHKLAFEKGVVIALGTDAPVGGEHPHTGLEVQLMIDNIGMTINQALQSATINAARALRIDDETGSLDVGKIADIVVLDGDLDKDINILQNMKYFATVIRNGFIVSESGRLKV